MFEFRLYTGRKVNPDFLVSIVALLGNWKFPKKKGKVKSIPYFYFGFDLGNFLESFLSNTIVLTQF